MRGQVPQPERPLLADPEDRSAAMIRPKGLYLARNPYNLRA